MRKNVKALVSVLCLGGIILPGSASPAMGSPMRQWGVVLADVPDAGAWVVSNTKDNNYAIADVTTQLNIRQSAGTQYPVVAKLPKDGLCYVESSENGWSFITSGDVEGYVYSDYLISELDGDIYIEGIGEENVQLAYWEDEIATISSYWEGGIRNQIVTYAMQFVGNPYLWGGTSLTQGADCSGFIQTVYRDFGIEISRVSTEQAQNGQQISVEEAQPGDLIFYAKEDGIIYHVVMYIGNGQAVHASSRETGIKISDVYYPEAVSAVRILQG